MSMRARHSAPLAILSLLVAPVVAHAQSDTRYVAPTNETVTTYIEEGMGSRPSAVLWVRNTSTVPIKVFSVTLRSCENVFEDCAPRPLDLRVGPGRSAIIGHVEPRDPEKGYTYRYTFGWRADSADAVLQRVLAQGGAPQPQAQAVVTSQPPVAEPAVVVQRMTTAPKPTITPRDIILGPQELAVLGPQIVRLGVEPDSVVLQVGQSFLMHQVRVYAYGLQGNMLGRVAAYQGRVSRGVLLAHGDTATAQHAGRSRLEFRLAPPAAPLTAIFPVIVIPAPQ